MTPEQRWQVAVNLSKKLGRKPTALDVGIMWADDRIKVLEAKLKKQESRRKNEINEMLWGKDL